MLKAYVKTKEEETNLHNMISDHLKEVFGIEQEMKQYLASKGKRKFTKKEEGSEDDDSDDQLDN